jgi:hypothetical protein
MRLIILSAIPIAKDLTRITFCVFNLSTVSLTFMIFLPPRAYRGITANSTGFTVGWITGRNVRGFGKTFSPNEMHLPRSPRCCRDVEVPKDLADRVEIVAHDFFTPQPVKNVDMYLFRWIFHDWSDKYSVLILQNLIPALKHGARIVIGEVCLPGPEDNVSHVLERRMRYVNFVMKSCMY